MRRKIGVLLVASFTAMMLGACGSNGDNNKIGLTAQEYNIYLATEITAVTNQLTSRMANGNTIASDVGIDASSELTSITHSKEVINDCIDTVGETLNISESNSYYSDKTQVLELFRQALSELDTYEAAIKAKDSTAIRDSVTRMQLIFTSLTSVSNPVYK